VVTAWAVAAGPDARRQSGREPVRGEHVEHPVLDEGQGRDLLAAQARGPPDAHDAQPRLHRIHELATRPQVFT